MVKLAGVGGLVKLFPKFKMHTILDDDNSLYPSHYLQSRYLYVAPFAPVPSTSLANME